VAPPMSGLRNLVWRPSVDSASPSRDPHNAIRTAPGIVLLFTLASVACAGRTSGEDVIDPGPPAATVSNPIHQTTPRVRAAPGPQRSDAGSTAAPCDPTKTTSCGPGAVCVARSSGATPTCEPLHDDPVDPGCSSCTADWQCAYGYACEKGFCREASGAVFILSTVEGPSQNGCYVRDLSVFDRFCCPTETDRRLSCIPYSPEGNLSCRCGSM
jgi:hypothetical protein